MRSQVVNIKLSVRLLKQLDLAAKANYQTRSSYIRQSVALRLNNQHVVDQPPKDEVLKRLGIV